MFSKIYTIDTGYMSSPTERPKISSTNTDGTTNYNRVPFGNIGEQCSTPLTYYKDSNGKEFLFTATTKMSGQDPTNLTDDETYYCFYAKNGACLLVLVKVIIEQVLL